MGRMTLPAGHARGHLPELLHMTGGTLAHLGDNRKVFIGSMTLETFDVIQSMDGVVPLFVDLWSYLLVAAGAGDKLLLL